MARFVMPVARAISNDVASAGNGWKLNFYVTGTTTRKDTFSDDGLTTANANPVVADSSGRFGDIFMESGTYKVVLTDAADVEIWTADPVDGATESSGTVLVKSTAYTVAIGDQSRVIAVDASAGAITITLLAAATAGDGFGITIKKTDSSANAVTIDGNGSETIDDAATQTLSSQYDALQLRCDGAGWHVIGLDLDIPPQAEVEAGTATVPRTITAQRLKQAIDALSPTDLPRSYLAGLGMSNDTDASHDIAVAVGECRDAANSVNMVVSSVITKQIDATWAAGDDAGGMNDGDAVGASEWFHVFLLSTADGATVDAGFDTSLTAAGLLADTAVIAAGLTKYRRIGSVLTDGSSNILGFTQAGDEFLWDDPPLSISTTALGTTAVNFVIATPPGVRCTAHMNFQGNGAESPDVYISSPDSDDEAPADGTAPLYTLASNEDTAASLSLRTNTSSQIRMRSSIASTDVDGAVLGWNDRRGRDD